MALTNTTEARVGAFGTYGITYQYQFGDGTANVNVNAGSGSAGDRNVALNHTFALSSTDQAQWYCKRLHRQFASYRNHIAVPFISSTFTVHVEPRRKSKYCWYWLQ